MAACSIGRPKSQLGHGLAAQPSGAPGLRGLLQRAVTTRRPRAGWRGGVLAGCSAVARRQQGVAGDLEGVTGKVPGKQEGAGAHRNGGSTVRREESSVMVAFASGEGAPVVMVECDEVLQLWRVKWVRKLQENVRIGGSGRCSPGNGGRWRRSAGIRVREGLPVTEGSGLGVGSGWERCGA
jgi:hypothetical protein